MSAHEFYQDRYNYYLAQFAGVYDYVMLLENAFNFAERETNKRFQLVSH